MVRIVFRFSLFGKIVGFLQFVEKANKMLRRRKGKKVVVFRL